METAPSMHVTMRDLPASLQNALKSIGYARPDVEVTMASRTSLDSTAMGDGYQGFTLLVNLSTGETHTERGSWGGRNMFESSPVDTDEKVYTLPTFGAVIKGQRGGGLPVSARVIIHPDNAPKELMAGSNVVSDRERDILSIYIGATPAYRKELLGSYYLDAAPGEVDALVERGYLKRNKAGATQITTTGKNVVGTHRYRRI
jgi:hypothetical protein